MPRRSASTSSVETIDGSLIRWRSEDDVLRPFEQDEELPEFVLENATVLGKDGETMANALDVEYQGPFIIRGYLVIGPKDFVQKKRLVNRIRGPVPLESKACDQYAFNHPLESGTQPEIWIRASAGWYTINPSPQYQDIYRHMCGVVLLNDGLQIAYNELYDLMGDSRQSTLKKMGHGREIREVFSRCSAKIGTGMVLEDVVNQVSKSHKFLSAHMSSFKGSALLSVLKSGNEQDIQKKLQDLLSPLDDSPDFPLPESTAQQQRSRISKSASVRGKNAHPSASPALEAESGRSSSAPRSSARLRSRSTPGETTKADIPVPTTRSIQRSPSSSSSSSSSAEPVAPSESMSPFESVFHALEQAYEELAPTKKGCTIPGTLNKLYFSYRTPAYRDKSIQNSHRFPVEDVISYNAQQLVERLDKSKWAGHEFYDSFLVKKAKETFQPKAMKLADFPFTLLRRESRPRVSSGAPAAEPSVPSVPIRAAQVDSEEEEEPARLSTPRRGKAPKGPRPSQSGLRVPSKRRYSILDDSSDEDSDEPTRKSNSLGRGEPVKESVDQNGKLDEAPNDTPIKLVIRADRVPSTAPRGPDNTWTCEEEDCEFLIRGSDAAECQRRIQEHFHEHEEDANRVNLALTEGRGQRIDHLLDKLKKAGKQSGQQCEMNGKVLEPISRRLIV